MTINIVCPSLCNISRSAKQSSGVLIFLSTVVCRHQVLQSDATVSTGHEDLRPSAVPLAKYLSERGVCLVEAAERSQAHSLCPTHFELFRRKTLGIRHFMLRFLKILNRWANFAASNYELIS
jgi:hypothetical protein